MSSNINTVLAECEEQAQALVAEIAKYRAAGQLSEETARTLDKLCDALEEVFDRVEPLTELRLRRTVLVLGTMLMVNTVLLVAILVALLQR